MRTLASCPVSARWQVGAATLCLAHSRGPPVSTATRFSSVPMTTVPESCDTHDLPVCHGAAEPVLKPHCAEHRVLARSEALIVQLGAVVASLDVRDHLPGILIRGQVS